MKINSDRAQQILDLSTNLKPKSTKRKMNGDPGQEKTKKKKTTELNLIQIGNELQLTELGDKSKLYNTTMEDNTTSTNNTAGPSKGDQGSQENAQNKEIKELRKEVDILKTNNLNMSLEIQYLWSWINYFKQGQQGQQQQSQCSGPVQLVQQSSDHQQSFCAQLLDDSSMTRYNNSLQALFGGYTKAQLMSDTEGITDYSKAAKHLFRRLYREEEYRGRTLTGSRPNKTYESRPRLQDPTKLAVIYEIIKEKYCVGPVQVRDKLRELLKPSRSATATTTTSELENDNK